MFGLKYLMPIVVGIKVACADLMGEERRFIKVIGEYVFTRGGLGCNLIIKNSAKKLMNVVVFVSLPWCSRLYFPQIAASIYIISYALLIM